MTTENKDEQPKKRGIDDSKFEPQAHACFPFNGEGEDPRKIYWLRIKRRLGDGEEWCAKDFAADDIKTWEDVTRRYGGGTYKLYAMSPGFRWQGETQWQHFEGEPLPLNTTSKKPEVTPARPAAPAPVPAPVAVAGPSLEQTLLLKAMDNQTAILTAVLANKSQTNPLELLAGLQKLMPNGDPLGQLKQVLELRDRFDGGNGKEADGGFEGKIVDLVKMLKDGAPKEDEKTDKKDVVLDGFGKVTVERSEFEAQQRWAKREKELKKQIKALEERLDNRKTEKTPKHGPERTHVTQSYATPATPAPPWQLNGGVWWCYANNAWWYWDGLKAVRYEHTVHSVEQVIPDEPRDDEEEEDDVAVESEDSFDGELNEKTATEEAPKSQTKASEAKPAGFDMSTVQEMMKDPGFLAFASNMLDNIGGQK